MSLHPNVKFLLITRPLKGFLKIEQTKQAQSGRTILNRCTQSKRPKYETPTIKKKKANNSQGRKNGKKIGKSNSEKRKHK